VHGPEAGLKYPSCRRRKIRPAHNLRRNADSTQIQRPIARAGHQKEPQTKGPGSIFDILSELSQPRCQIASALNGLPP
jgi:hypothetical protein